MEQELIRIAALFPDLRPAEDVREAAIWKDLIRYLRWQNHPDPEEGAQETIVRALAKAESEDNWKEAAENPRRYLFGFAWCIAREGWRKPRGESFEARFGQVDASGPRDDTENRILVDELLAMLDPKDRELLVRYHSEDRESLSRELGVSIGALRVNVHRICMRLRREAGIAGTPSAHATDRTRS